MIKLIASDLDGTLLLNGAQDLPEEMFDLMSNQVMYVMKI